MNYSIFRFTLNMHNHRSQASVSAVNGDTAVRLLINLTDGGVPYLIGDGCTAVLSGTKADGMKLWNRCVIVDGTTIQYDFTEQTSNCAGVANCEITLYDAEGKIVTSPKFTIVIDEREVKDDDIPISENETAFLDQIAIDETARADAEKKRGQDFDNFITWASEEELNRIQAEEKRGQDFDNFIAKVDDAETARADAEAARVDAETARAKAEEGRVTAETLRNEGVTGIMYGIEQAENDRVYAEECRVQAETSRAEAEEGRVQAEVERAKAEEGRVQVDTERQKIVEDLQEGFAIVSASATANTAKIENLDTKYASAVGDLEEDVSALNTKTTFLHTNRTRITGIKLTEDRTNYRYTFQLRGRNIKNNNGVLSEGEVENIGDSVTIDLPLESVVTNGIYDDATGKIILTLHNGNKVEFPVTSLINGLVSAKTLDDEIEKIDVELAQHIEVINEVVNTATSNETRISSAETTLADHRTRISNAETNITEHGAKISNAENKLTNHGERISNAETNITEHGAKISNAENKLTNHGERISTAETKLTEYGKNLSTLSSGKLDKLEPTEGGTDYLYATYFDTTNEEIKETLIPTSTSAVEFTVATRMPGGRLAVGRAVSEQDAVQFVQFKEATHPIPEHTEKIADNTNKIADNTKRIENLENTLLTFEEDSSEAYVKNAPAGSAPNVMLNSVGGKSKKSKNLLRYMTRGLRCILMGDGIYTPVMPGETVILSDVVTINLRHDGGVYVCTHEPLPRALRIDFDWGNGGTAVTEDGETTYIPKGGLQIGDTSTFSVTHDSPFEYPCIAYAFGADKGASGYLGNYYSGYNSCTVNPATPDCNNLQLVCLSIEAQASCEEIFYPMFNEGDTALPFELNKGITDSAVTDVTYFRYGENLFNIDGLKDFTCSENVTVNFNTKTINFVGSAKDHIARFTRTEDFFNAFNINEVGNYKFACNGKVDIYIYRNGTQILNITPHAKPFTVDQAFLDKVNDLEGGYYISVYFIGTLGSSVGDIRITRSEEELPYKPYSSESVGNFPIPQAIRDLPDYGKEFTYIDFDRKVFVDAGHDVTLDGSADEHWNIDSAGPYMYTQVTQYGHPAPDASNVHIATVCERFKDVSQSSTLVIPYESVRTVALNSSIYFRTGVASTLAQWKAYIASNPIKVRYRVAEPVETDISKYLTGYDEYKMLKVGSGDIVFHNEKKNEVPSTITYVKAKE